MMHLAAFARHLHAEQVVVYGQAGATCFLEHLPPEPVDAVGVYAIPRGGDTLHPWGNAGVQLIVRADGSTGAAREGYERCADLRAILHGLRHVTLAPGTPDELRLVSCIAQTRTPVSLGRDAEQRFRWSVGFDLQILLETRHTIA